MFWEDDDENENLPSEVIHFLENRFVTVHSNIQFVSRSEYPTHTEDGIPIRKLYVSNLPPKTTRTELFAIFAPHGFIQNCWLRLGDSSIKNTGPLYAFITYSDPCDAHKALRSQIHERILRGRTLRVSPADSWHQPKELPNGQICWNSYISGKLLPQRATEEGASTSNCSAIEEVNEAAAEEQDAQTGDTILDVLNRDCMDHILSYVPMDDIIRSERVSKPWRAMIQEYLQGCRTLKTSQWEHRRIPLTTAVLRRLLARMGDALTRLHINHRWSVLNDRTAHIICKFCPNLEELKILDIHIKNWNSLLYGCKKLKSLSFISCSKVSDSSLVNFVNSQTSLEKLTVSFNTHVTGLFLAGSDERKLKNLSFHNCFCLQGTVLIAAMDTLQNLTTFKMDSCPVSMWKYVPQIISKLPQLEELSLSKYTSIGPKPQEDEFCKALQKLTELKRLNLSRNIFVTKGVMKQIALSCSHLQSLDVSGCNETWSGTGVCDESVSAVLQGCRELSRLDVSYLVALRGGGLGAGGTRLAVLTARGCLALAGAALGAALRHRTALTTLDLCGCDALGEDLLGHLAGALDARRDRTPLTVWLAGTPAASAYAQNKSPKHSLLTVDITNDRCDAQLRADFVDQSLDSSDDSLFEYPSNFEDMMDSDDDIYYGDFEDLDEDIYALLM